MKPKSYRRKTSHRKLNSSGAAPDLATRERAGQVVRSILAELPALLAVAVVDTATGASLAAHANSPAIDPGTAAAYNAEVVRQKQKAIAALRLTEERVADILITLSTQLHLLTLSPDGQRFIYLVVNTRDTNLAIAREVLRTEALELA